MAREATPKATPVRLGPHDFWASPTASQAIPANAATSAAISLRWRNQAGGGGSTARRVADGVRSTGRGGAAAGDAGCGAEALVIAERILSLSMPLSESVLTASSVSRLPDAGCP